LLRLGKKDGRWGGGRWTDPEAKHTAHKSVADSAFPTLADAVAAIVAMQAGEVARGVTIERASRSGNGIK
jgi:cytidine deaminase